MLNMYQIMKESIMDTVKDCLKHHPAKVEEIVEVQVKTTEFAGECMVMVVRTDHGIIEVVNVIDGKFTDFYYVEFIGAKKDLLWIKGGEYIDTPKNLNARSLYESLVA